DLASACDPRVTFARGTLGDGGGGALAREEAASEGDPHLRRRIAREELAFARLRTLRFREGQAGRRVRPHDRTLVRERRAERLRNRGIGAPSAETAERCDRVGGDVRVGRAYELRQLGAGFLRRKEGGRPRGLRADRGFRIREE